ncbi:MAG: multidrug transporter ATP-binding protein [Fibrobacteres bacterium]|nr:multidrug transporter ATP-binding protein [Fibrobacterota bacterium]
MESIVSIRSLAKDHAGEKALRGISLEVPDPCLFGLIGADGAGKSTLMNILATLSDPDSGEVRMLGLDLRKGFPRIRDDIGYMPQRFSLYQDLSVLENLDFFADIFGIRGKAKAERMDHLLEFAGLAPFKGRRAGLLSGGMKQKLALACTLIHHPKLLLLDEPTVGVDPVARRDFWTMLKSLRAQGISLIVSTPYMDEAALCDSLALLHQGAVIAGGSPAEMLAAYPYRLYRVEAAPDARISTLNYPGDKPPPPGFELIYPSGGSLHAAEKPGQAGDPLGRLRLAVPEAASATMLEPALEDCFFALLSGKTANAAGGA